MRYSKIKTMIKVWTNLKEKYFSWTKFISYNNNNTKSIYSPIIGGKGRRWLEIDLTFGNMHKAARTKRDISLLPHLRKLNLPLLFSVTMFFSFFLNSVCHHVFILRLNTDTKETEPSKFLTSIGSFVLSCMCSVRINHIGLFRRQLQSLALSYNGQTFNSLTIASNI